MAWLFVRPQKTKIATIWPTVDTSIAVVAWYRSTRAPWMTAPMQTNRLYSARPNGPTNDGMSSARTKEGSHSVGRKKPRPVDLSARVSIGSSTAGFVEAFIQASAMAMRHSLLEYVPSKMILASQSQNGSLFIYERSVGRKAFDAVTGKRPFTKYIAGASRMAWSSPRQYKIEVCYVPWRLTRTIAQTLRAVRKPQVSSSHCSIKGTTTPALPVPAQTIP